MCDFVKTSSSLRRRHSRPQSLRSFWLAAGIESSGLSPTISGSAPFTDFSSDAAVSRITTNSVISFAHTQKIGCGQSSRFPDRWSEGNVGSGNENVV